MSKTPHFDALDADTKKAILNVSESPVAGPNAEVYATEYSDPKHPNNAVIREIVNDEIQKITLLKQSQHARINQSIGSQIAR